MIGVSLENIIRKYHFECRELKIPELLSKNQLICQQI